ncbi:hypothetical protein H0H93_001492 [Arthromyces matolae]|nr:hypothetical protein H0H93_001492 [Arthromyces matolae]
MSTSLAGEQTPLLSNASTRRSSIPWSQFSIALWIQLVEPLSTQVIAPFAPQLIRDIGITHGDETKVGYYVGILLGPYTGGLLAHPAEQFPAVFGNDFWRTYPYLLPCAVPAIVAALCSVITYLFLKETVQHPRPLRSWWTQSKCDGASPDHDPSADREPLLSDAERPKSLRELLTRKVLITATNYGLLALIDSALRTLQPVIYSTPISLIMTPSDDEETPLLQEHSKKRTPLPWAQFTIVMFLQLAEPLTSQVIYPFAPQLIRDIGITHGNEMQVGYYVGLMQSLFFLTQAFTVLHWSRTSDFIGRKPVLLMGLFGLSISMFCFGLSRTFWGLVLSRCLNGALNGNIGVMKSIMVELTDSTNIALAYSYQPIAWSTGSTLGPIIGGSLARPADRFPALFGNNDFLKRYPYFLPCAVPATFTAIAWLVTLLFFKETLKAPVSISQVLKRRSASYSSPAKGVIGSQEPPTLSEPDLDAEEKPLPLSALLTPRVIIAAGNYAVLSLVDIALRAIHPLFFATPVALGGLGLSPPVIGKILSVFGLCNGAFQVFFFARIHERFGSKKTFIGGLATAFPCFLLFPVVNSLAKAQGMTLFVWVLVIFQILISIGLRAIFIFIAAASPNRASLGATNGLSQMTVSIMRAIGPAAANSLFSLSMEKGYLDGYLVYYVLIGVALMALSQTQTQQSQREVDLAIAERNRKEELKRKKAEEQQQKEQELERKRRMIILDQERREKERQLKREREQAAIEAERQKRADLERQSYQHGPKKIKSDGVSTTTQSRTREEPRRKRPSDDEGDSAEVLTREEKRKRKQEQEMRRAFFPTKRSTTSSHKPGRRLPGGAVDITTESQPASDSSLSKKSVRERLAAMPNTLTKLNTVKRDTRTIDEIIQDRAKLREGKTLDGDQARTFDNWFTDKKDSKKVVPTSTAPSRTNTPGANTPSPRGSATPQPSSSSSSSKKPAPPHKQSLLKTAATKAAASSTSTSKSNSVSSKPKPSTTSTPTSSRAFNGSTGGKSSASMGKKRPRSPSPSEESDSDSYPRQRQPASGISNEIWKIFGKDRNQYVNDDVFRKRQSSEGKKESLFRRGFSRKGEVA